MVNISKKRICAEEVPPRYAPMPLRYAQSQSTKRCVEKPGKEPEHCDLAPEGPEVPAGDGSTHLGRLGARMIRFDQFEEALRHGADPVDLG